MQQLRGTRKVGGVFEALGKASAIYGVRNVEMLCTLFCLLVVSLLLLVGLETNLGFKIKFIKYHNDEWGTEYIALVRVCNM